MGPVWSGAENLATIVTRSPDPAARSESLCRLSYPGPLYCYYNNNNYYGSLDDFQLMTRELRKRADNGNAFQCGLTSFYATDIGLRPKTILNCVLCGFALSVFHLLHVFLLAMH